MDNNYFMGLDGFVWFTGVVEDRNDPAKLGRVRVRCVGFHTENKNDILDHCTIFLISVLDGKILPSFQI